MSQSITSHCSRHKSIELPVSVCAADAICKWVARRVYARVKGFLEFDDLVSEAWVGLIKSLPKYDASKSSFNTYMRIRVLGSVLDFVRNSAWAPRLEQTRRKKNPEHKITSVNSYSSFDSLEKQSFMAVENDVSGIDNADEIDHIFACLQPQSQSLLTDYFINGKSMKEIAKKEGLSESMISLRMAKLRAYLLDRRQGVANRVQPGGV